MAVTYTVANVRLVILISDVKVLPDATIQFYMDLTDEEVNVTDIPAKLFYTSWKLATNLDWDKIESSNGVKFKKPNPGTFQNQYMDRLKQLGEAKPKKINYAKTADPTEY